MTLKAGRIFFGFLPLLVLFNLDCVFAAEKVKVIEDSSLQSKPSETSRVLESLSEGEEILVGTKKSNGFVRAKSKTGKVGWIRESAISQEKEEGKDLPRNTDRTAEDSSGLRKFLRFNFGLSLFNLSEITSVLSTGGSLSVANGIHLGAGFGFPLFSSMNLVLRLEYIAKGVSATDSNTNQQFEFAAASLPLMGGLEWALLQSDRFALSLGGYGGLGLLTKFSSTALNYTSNNVTTLSASPLTFLFLVHTAFKPSKTSKLAFVGEAGYRILKTTQLTPTEPVGVVNGSNSFASNGTYVPVAINLSGIILSLGVGFYF